MSQSDPTQWLGIGWAKKMLERTATNGNWKLIVKTLTAAGLSIVAAILIVSQNWGQMFRESGVTLEKQQTNAAQIEEVKREYVRKDVLQPRLDSIEDSIREAREERKEIRQQLIEMNKLQNQILIEIRRGR